MKHLIAGIVASGAMVLSGAAQAEEINWHMAMPYTATSTAGRTAQAFIDEVASLSDGQFKIVLHANSSLFPHSETKRAVETGQVQLAQFLMLVAQNEDALFGLDGLPFLANSYDEAEVLAAAQHDAISAKLEGTGGKLLYTFIWPGQGFASAIPLDSAEALSGKKFRAYSPGTARFGELAGAQPVQVQSADLIEAFATGAVHTTITAPNTVPDFKLWDVLDYFYPAEITYPKDVIVANLAAYEALSPEMKEVLQKAAESATKVNKDIVGGGSDADYELMRKQEMTVEPLPEATLAKFQSIGETLQNEWAESVGQTGKDILTEYRSKK